MSPADFGVTPETFYAFTVVGFLLLCLAGWGVLKLIDHLITQPINRSLDKKGRYIFWGIVWLLIFGGIRMLGNTLN